MLRGLQLLSSRVRDRPRGLTRPQRRKLTMVDEGVSNPPPSHAGAYAGECPRAHAHTPPYEVGGGVTRRSAGLREPARLL